MLVTFNKTQFLVQILDEVVYASFFRIFARFLEIFHNHPVNIYLFWICEILKQQRFWPYCELMFSTCLIVFDFWELSHVIFLQLTLLVCGSEHQRDKPFLLTIVSYLKK